MAVFVHIVKTGGTTVEDYLRESAQDVGWDFYNLWSEADEHTSPEHYVVDKDPSFIALNKSAYAEPRPKIVLILHNGVPGIGDPGNFWETLEPMRAMLRTKGCDMQLSTLLRQPFNRLLSDYTFNELKYVDTVQDKQEHCSSDPCVYAAWEPNLQLKYLLAGDTGTWPPEFHWAQPAVPTSNSSSCRTQAESEGGQAHRGNATYDSETLLPRAREVLSKFNFVGRSENMTEFLTVLGSTIGRPSVGQAADQNQGPAPLPLSSAGEVCFASASVADDALYSDYCS